MAQQPLFRLTISNKNGSERRYTDYQGKKVSKKHQPCGAIFQNDEGRMYIAAKEAFSYDPEENWLNIFKNEPRDSDDEDEAPKSNKPANKGKGKPAKKQDDESDPFEDD